MENLMCWEMDYKLFAELKKAQEAWIEEKQHTARDAAADPRQRTPFPFDPLRAASTLRDIA
jgi:uncharacterized protein YecT (DUF1311 family)